MTDASWIVFGPDLEPLESDARRLAASPGARRDGLLVSGTAADIAAELAKAAGGWCRFEQVGPDGGAQPVHVNSRMVRFVAPAGD